jgi:hypothetical protein
MRNTRELYDLFNGPHIINMIKNLRLLVGTCGMKRNTTKQDTYRGNIGRRSIGILKKTWKI